MTVAICIRVNLKEQFKYTTSKNDSEEYFLLGRNLRIRYSGRFVECSNASSHESFEPPHPIDDIRRSETDRSISRYKHAVILEATKYLATIMPCEVLKA